MHVKPKTPELVIRDPRSRTKLPPEGALVPDTSYWFRRLRDGDVVKVTPAKATPAKAKKKTETPSKPETPTATTSEKSKE